MVWLTTLTMTTPRLLVATGKKSAMRICSSFLLLAALLVQHTVFARPADKCSRRDADVLILGAGMAGISAAKTLSDGGVSRFLILEAQDQMGGRVRSTVLPSSGLRVELGANWIQGIDPSQPERHPLWSIAEKCGGLQGRFTETFSNGTIHIFDEKGKNITNSTLFQSRLGQWNKILDPGLGLYAKKREAANLSDITLRQALRDLGWTPSSPLDDAIEWLGTDLDEFATSPEFVSLYNNFPDDTYTKFGPNSKNYFVSDQEEGFVKVVTCLAKDFLAGKNDGRLHLGSIVEEVDWSNDECVCVTTRENGTLREYCAPDAILTFSLGVLQSDEIKFSPEITKKKATLDKAQFALYLKIFLEFEEIFWKQEANIDSILHVDTIRGNFILFEPITATAPVLFATVTGEMAKNIYNQSLESAKLHVMVALRAIYGQDVPNPISVIIPDWWVNPFFLGMYSNIPVDFKDEDLKYLREPLDGLHFGGEVTSDDTGYVHGGYFSGIRTAQEILNKH